MHVTKTAMVCVLLVMMAINILLIGEQIITSEQKPFSLITDHELDMLIDALDDKVHTCDEWCSDFICYIYEATSCKTWYCENLFLKEKKNVKYCSKCRG